MDSWNVSWSIKLKLFQIKENAEANALSWPKWVAAARAERIQEPIIAHL